MTHQLLKNKIITSDFKSEKSKSKPTISLFCVCFLLDTMNTFVGIIHCNLYSNEEPQEKLRIILLYLINYNNSCVCLMTKEKSLFFFFTLTHTNYLSQNAATLCTFLSIFFSMHSSLSWLSSFSLNDSLLTAFSFLFMRLSLSLLSILYAAHPHAFYTQKSFNCLRLLFLA